MSLSKESRQRLLDAKLFKGEMVNYPLFNAFLEEFHEESIDQRTFERDIKSLKTILADKHDDDSTNMLHFNRNTNSYAYLNGYFAFEETAMVKGTKLGKLLKYNRNFITDIDKSVRNQIDALIKEFIDEEDIKIPWQPVQYINSENGGQANFPEILNHIVSKQALKFQHTNLSTKTTKTQFVIPLLLKELDNGFAKGWYMLGQKFEEGDKKIQLDVKKLSLFAIDRIVDIAKYRPFISVEFDNDFDPNLYFEHSFRGLHRKNLSDADFGPQSVKLEITEEWIIEFLKRYPLHRSQKIFRENDKTFAAFHIEPAFDLEKFIFSNSEALLVIEPESLRHRVSDMIRKSAAVYGVL